MNSIHQREELRPGPDCTETKGLLLSTAESEALSSLLRNAIMDTSSNRAAHLYERMLEKLGLPSARLPVRQFLDISSIHLSAEDQAFLDRSAEPDERAGVAAMRGIYGWFVYAHDERAVAEVSDGLWAILVKARELGCDYVLFDADGPEDPELPRYEQLADLSACRCCSPATIGTGR